MGTSENYANYPCLPFTTPNVQLQHGKTSAELERISPGLLPQFQFPPVCSALWGVGNRGGKRDYSWSSPGEESGGDEERDRGIPGTPAALTPRRALPALAAPAGRKRSLCGCASRRCPFPARRGAGRAVSTAPVKFTGVGLAGPPYRGFPPGSRLLAAGGRARMAAPLTPASARPCPPGRGHSSRASSSL